MEFLPANALEKLEYDKILDRLEKKCLGQPGRETILKLKPRTEKVIIERQLRETFEYMDGALNDARLPLGNYEDITHSFRMLRIEDNVLPIEEIIAIKIQLQIVGDIFSYFTPERIKEFPTLYNLIRPLSFDETLVRDINKIIDEEGEVRPTASEELMRITKAITSKHRELNKQFQEEIKTFKSKGWLTDNVESVKNGRRVLSVPSEHKRKVKGIMHDESGTGRTAFIEPERIIEINNDIFDLENDKKHEIYKILRDLCNRLRPYIPVMGKYQELIEDIDVIQAKAGLGIEMDAQMPKVVEGKSFKFLVAYHPLLLLINKAENKETVPFTLELHGSNRILMLSGPNAGGKSVSMKGVGLVQMMVQSGMLVPCEEESVFGIFSKVFTDIGDQQSLEDDLSTYSSRLKNMKGFLRDADEDTLLLIDEFGSGTDPKIGGAIAEAILKELHAKKVYGVITTHYSNLKVFAFKTKGIVNGSMYFDKDNLTPTYELQVGRPGSSYGYEIAHKIGLDKKVIKYAKHKTGKNERAVDQLLIDLQREKQELEEKLDAATKRQKDLDILIRKYEQMSRDIEVSRKKLKLEAKELAMQQNARDNKQLEKLVKEIKEQKDLDKAKELAKQARERRKQTSEKVSALRDDLYHNEVKKDDAPIKVGDFVKLASGGATGKVERIDNKKATILVGQLRMTAKLRDLRRAADPLEINRNKPVTNNLKHRASFNAKIDLRGMRRDDALATLEKFVDEALINGSSHLEILHGKGDGILRKAVRMKLKEYPAISSIKHPPSERGGDGITLVEMD